MARGIVEISKLLDNATKSGMPIANDKERAMTISFDATYVSAEIVMVYPK